MKGPHDDDIKGPDPSDKARARLEEFISQRLPEPSPATTEGGEAGDEAKPNPKKPGTKKRSK
jgi:hypothetical protein